MTERAAVLDPPAQEQQPACAHGARRRHYQFGRASGALCIQCAMLYRPVLRRALVLAAVIGSVLTIINQGDILLAGAVTPLVVTKIALTYTVPYLVSTFSALQANKST